MLPQGAFLFNSSGGAGSGSYTVDVNFTDAGMAQFMAPGDTIVDSSGVSFSVTTWSIFPSDFGNNGTVTVAPLGADVAPANSTVLGDASAFTPGQVDLGTKVQTGGVLNSQSLIEGRTYRYRCSAGFFVSADANDAVVGDAIIDSRGKAFEIVALSGQPNAFSQPFEVVEAEKVGDPPNIGACYLFRPTPYKGFYQGQTLSQLAEDAIRNRDELITDLCFQSLSGVSGVAGTGVGGGTGAGAIDPSEIVYINGASGTITNDNTLILVDESGSVTVQMSGSFDDGKILYIKDAYLGTSDRGVNTITIVPTLGDTIDGGASFDIVNLNQSLTLIQSSGVWYLV